MAAKLGRNAVLTPEGAARNGGNQMTKLVDKIVSGSENLNEMHRRMNMLGGIILSAWEDVWFEIHEANFDAEGIITVECPDGKYWKIHPPGERNPMRFQISETQSLGLMCNRKLRDIGAAEIRPMYEGISHLFDWFYGSSEMFRQRVAPMLAASTV